MKYCTKCGFQLTDDTLFCPKCGTKSVPLNVERTAIPMQTYYTPPANPKTHMSNNAIKMRTSMKIWMIACFVFAGIFGFAAMSNLPIIGLTLFFFVLGLMFYILSYTPKGSQSIYVKSKPSKIKKCIFVVLCAVFAFIICGIVTSNLSSNRPANAPFVQQELSNSSFTSSTENMLPQDTTTLSDVEKWYKNQTPAVSQSLIDYSKSIKGLSFLNVDSGKFRFGEDNGWYDCHYTFYFTCKVNGITYGGEARAFMKYQDNTVNWYHFEIFSNTGIQSLVEHFDDSFEQIIEDYYIELESKYK